MFGFFCKKDIRKKLSDIDRDPYSLAQLKEKYVVLIIDDKQFDVVETLRNNGFRVDHWRDIEDISSVEKYPIVACDVSGIGEKLRPGSRSGGIHVLNEIKKHYPDKYLIQYSTRSQDLDENLTKADLIYPKDTGIDAWQRDVEQSFRELGNPKKRWLRIRKKLSDEGVDAYEIFRIEQAYIKEITGGEECLESVGKEVLSPEIGDLIVRFAASTLAMGIKEAMS